MSLSNPRCSHASRKAFRESLARGVFFAFQHVVRLSLQEPSHNWADGAIRRHSLVVVTVLFEQTPGKDSRPARGGGPGVLLSGTDDAGRNIRSEPVGARVRGEKKPRGTKPDRRFRNAEEKPPGPT